MAEIDKGVTPPSATDAPEGFVYDPVLTARRTSSSGFLLDALRRRRAGRAILSGLTTLLFVAGAGMFAYPFFTDLYTDNIIQNRLENEFAQIEVGTVEEWAASIRGQQGAALTKIAIPAIGLETLVVEGTSPAALRAGAGHYPNTPLPGQTGNVAIAGHRTTYGRPFNEVDKLKPGDVIWLSTPVGDHKYVVSSPPDGWDANPYITDPRDWSVIATPPGGEGRSFLTLTSCHPKGQASQRIIVRADLTESHPAGYYEAHVSAQAAA